MYEELGILDQVALRPIRHFTRLQDRAADVVIHVTADLGALQARLTSYFPTDANEIERLMNGARRIADLSPMLEQAHDLFTWRDGLKYLWQMRHELAAAAHFRKPLPLACASGRRAVQVLCADRGVPFVIPPRAAHTAQVPSS